MTQYSLCCNGTSDRTFAWVVPSKTLTTSRAITDTPVWNACINEAILRFWMRLCANYCTFTCVLLLLSFLSSFVYPGFSCITWGESLLIRLCWDWCVKATATNYCWSQDGYHASFSLNQSYQCFCNLKCDVCLARVRRGELPFLFVTVFSCLSCLVRKRISCFGLLLPGRICELFYR